MRVMFYIVEYNAGGMVNAYHQQMRTDKGIPVSNWIWNSEEPAGTGIQL